MVASNESVGMVAPVVWFGRRLESGMRQPICVGVFGRNLASVTMKMFSHLIYVINKLYEYTFNVICKDNAAINCITLQHKKVSFLSTLMSHTLVLKIIAIESSAYLF
jgi:hypothetical protein